MKLHEIINSNEKPDVSILYETLHPYLNSLYKYYLDYFCCEPILMVTDVFNAAQYCKIVSSNDYSEELNEYLDTCHLDNETRQCSEETINFNSKYLKEFINH